MLNLSEDFTKLNYYERWCAEGYAHLIAALGALIAQPRIISGHARFNAELYYARNCFKWCETKRPLTVGSGLR